ncbi:hypothetical protein HGRIS_000393 [Hohenbuehelia grisea]|uniref:F-box domain-containing protein n=1 Tax=Hohenbuehelia grisea TaxID=104357 RepID=A0ABR3JRU8_9AGAR
METSEPLVEQYTNQTDIDDEVVKYQQIIRRLWNRRNTLSAVSRLPTETLSIIFELRAAEASNATSVGAHDKRWLSITGVCSRWREVARACPNLWGYFHCRERPEWLEEKLRLSKAAPIHIVCSNNYSPRSEVVLATLLEYHNRIFTLDIVSGLDALKLAGPVLPKMTQLRVLRLRLAHSSVPGEIFTSPNDFAKCDAPQLGRIEFYSIRFYWNSALINNINELRVILSPTDSLQPILLALTKTTRLEVLELREFLQRPSSNVITNNPLPHPNLPHLTTLSITQQYFDTPSPLDFLSHITCPKLSNLQLSLRGIPSQSSINLDGIITMSAIVLNNRVDVTQANLRTTPASVSFGVLSDSVGDEWSVLQLSSLSIDVMWDVSAPEIVRDSALNLLQFLPLRTVQTLLVNQAIPLYPTSQPHLLSTDDWVALLQGLPSLEELRVNVSFGVLKALEATISTHNDGPVSKSAASLPAPLEIPKQPEHSALRPSQEPGTAGAGVAATSTSLLSNEATVEGEIVDRETVLDDDNDLQEGNTFYVPLLRRFEIQGWSLRHGADEVADMDAASYRAETSLDALIGCLQARQEGGHGVEILGVQYCRHFTQEEVELLEGSVEELEVKWDGDEIFTIEDEESYEDSDDLDPYEDLYDPWDLW